MLTTAVYDLLLWLSIVPIRDGDVPVHKKGKRQQIFQQTKNTVRMNANAVSVRSTIPLKSRSIQTTNPFTGILSNLDIVNIYS